VLVLLVVPAAKYPRIGVIFTLSESIYFLL